MAAYVTRQWVVLMIMDANTASKVHSTEWSCVWGMGLGSVLCSWPYKVGVTSIQFIPFYHLILLFYIFIYRVSENYGSLNSSCAVYVEHKVFR
jgi:hypothetical protein